MLGGQKLADEEKYLDGWIPALLQRYKGTKVQRYKGTKVQRYKGTKMTL